MHDQARRGEGKERDVIVVVGVEGVVGGGVTKQKQDSAGRFSKKAPGKKATGVAGSKTRRET